ncbi:MAG: hypothetical protein A2W90_17225 [Bacteroidetes bacterium GWF2_42_66]|nr:MAG: hypothetical protein A2W92_07975 [Bacteroidetes bacterium GWA2_42_15]OFX96100.1 MAG: hypothetical protein A2W89_00190 [Bacteroidetes bacterium GWE2_42_39]OFY44186.1 MAG: hypothetical protein A2W90_17225 [Bacteroidetes bacterium GWF2_42_66]HBL75675.1 hypothetical protein [Prolixibacteraceae bacterium]HCR92203.1 hypothetical protein [Prolixibacteraceae bacterium]
MKKSKTLFIAFGFVAALGVGFLIGISVNYPRVDTDEIFGTIGKVNNYRNIKITEGDIQLKNELLADTSLQKLVKNYMDFFYLRALELENNIGFAVEQASAVAQFKINNTNQIIALESYGKFLSTARQDLLAAVIVCQSPEKTEPALLGHSISQAKNIIAQLNYRSKAVLNFITELDIFIQETKTGSFPGLKKAHDLLAYNEMVSSVVLNDQVLMKFFDKKKLFDNKLELPGKINVQEAIKQDMEQLHMPGYWANAEKLSLKDMQESLNIFDVEKLGIIRDAEHLGLVDATKLESFRFDSETFNSFWMD